MLDLNNPFHTAPLSYQVILLCHSWKASTWATQYPTDHPPSSRRGDTPSSPLRHLLCQACHLRLSSLSPHLIFGLLAQKHL